MAIDTDPELSPYLMGNFAAVHDELDLTPLSVTGTIPDALRGVYMRNGANPAFPPIGQYHLFDGDGMVHAIELADGNASYRNRFVRSRGLEYERSQGHAVFGGLSNWVMPSAEVIEAAGIMKNTANTNIIRHADRYLALMEGALPTEMTRELETIGEHDFGGALTGSMTAHPKWDPATGELLFFGYAPFPPFLRYHVVDRAGALVRSVDIDIPRPVMMHDFVVTERHVVFFDLPAVFDPMAMLNGEGFIRWSPEHGARIGVLPRDASTDTTRWFDLDPFYVFHFLNAWDDADGSTVTIDGCRAAALPIAFGDEPDPVGADPSLHRWTVDLGRGEVRDEKLDDRAADFPRINMHRSGIQHRYGYLAELEPRADGAAQFTAVRKYDLATGTSTAHLYGKDAEAGEAVFAPDPEGRNEDDGWLVNFVFDRSTGESELRIVDARALDEEPVARVHLPRRVPFGFHGNWMPDRGSLPSN